MKKIIVMTIALFAGIDMASAQFQVNPQFGLTYQRMTDPQIQGLDHKATVGWQFGADLRFGDRIYFQPGAFYGRNATMVKHTYSDTLSIQDDIVRTTLKLRPMIGYRIIDTYEFDLRFATGPSYDVLLSADNRYDRITFDRADMRNGTLNWDVALGFDMGYFTLEPSASFGLSRVFRENTTMQDLSTRYMTYALTIGINIGNNAD